MADQSSVELKASGSDSQNIPLNTGADAAPSTATTDTAAVQGSSAAAPADTAAQAPADTATAAAQNNAVVSPSQANVDTTAAQITPAPQAAAPGALPTDPAQTAAPVADANALVMNFSADCWLEVTDATGKKLFSGLQRKGGNLNLTGQAPYKLKIGAPAAVQIEYQGKPVDLSRFIRTNQVARLTVSAEQSPAQ